ncbi:MAG: hypothetical protein J4F29_21920, partial [Candidatus Latescibacteria bacterium]|nr:hypothetical protein [Candidatus Latescibacterota bacterium]
MKAGSVIYKYFILLVCIFGTGSSRGETTIDLLFQVAVEQVGQVSQKESIKALEEIISKDRDYAPAYNELAKLHLLDQTVNGRQRAMRMVQRAISSDPNNAEYRLTRGKIWWVQSFRFRALNQFKNVMKKHPENTDVLNSLGMFWVYDFLSQKDRRAAHHSMDMGFRIMDRGSKINAFKAMAMRPKIKDFKIFAEEAKQEAIPILRKSIELD